MTTSTGSTPATPGDGALTLKIRRTELLLRLFHLDSTLDVIRELPGSDERRAVLLKHWTATRDQLAREAGLAGIDLPTQ